MKKEDFVAPENYPIDSLRKLRKEMKYVMNQWLEAAVSDVDREDLKKRERKILQALSDLEITEEWKKRNKNLAAVLLFLVDNQNLLERITLVFDLWPKSRSVFAALQVLEEMKQALAEMEK